MITFIRGNDKGFILLKSLVVLLFFFILFSIILEVEFRKYIVAKVEYERLLEVYESKK